MNKMTVWAARFALCVIIWVAFALGRACHTPPRAEVTRAEIVRVAIWALEARTIATLAQSREVPTCDHAELEDRLVGVWCALAYVADRSGGRGSLLPKINPWGQPRCTLCEQGYPCNQTQHGADWRRQTKGRR